MAWDRIVTVYADLKIGTVSAWSWSTRMLTTLITSRQETLGPFTPFEPKEKDMQYLNPTAHKKFTNEIANYGREQLCNDLKKSWAVWYMQDGSVDVTQINHEFHSVRYIEFETGKLKHAFVSIEEVLGEGSNGQYESLKHSLSSLCGHEISSANVIEKIQERHKHVDLIHDEIIDDIFPQEQINKKDFEDPF